jgi:Fic family protein
MKSYSIDYINKLSVPLSLSIILDLCSRSQGKEDLWRSQRPEVLEALKQESIISSTESSNRIEGVTVEEGRLKPLIKGNVFPRDRPEEEVLGYKNALSWIHENYENIELSAETIKQLHLISQKGSIGDAGKWKEKNNEIIEVSPQGHRSIRFIPTEAKDVPYCIEQLCLAYSDAAKNNLFPPILLIATFIFDFLCIHPFRDGNGRVSRLLTLLLLYKSDYKLGKYISIERIVEETKEDYYESLKKSSNNWHSSKHDLLPFWFYFSRTIKIAYDRLADKFDMSEKFSGGKNQIIKAAIRSMPTKFKLGDLINTCPSVSRDLIQKVLKELKSQGVIELQGKGRGAVWIKLNKDF